MQKRRLFHSERRDLNLNLFIASVKTMKGVENDNLFSIFKKIQANFSRVVDSGAVEKVYFGGNVILNPAPRGMKNLNVSIRLRSFVLLRMTLIGLFQQPQIL